MSIPTAVFYTSDHRYILHWIERPEVADQEQREIEQAIRAENPDISDQEFGRERRTRSGRQGRSLAAGHRGRDYQQAAGRHFLHSQGHCRILSARLRESGNSCKSIRSAAGYALPTFVTFRITYRERGHRLFWQDAGRSF